MINYKLLTPGPLTTTETVKKEMLVDHCTWDEDYKSITQNIRTNLLRLAHVSNDEYTAVLMQGSGTFGVESVFSSVIGDEDKVLICSNGAYGKRMVQICEKNKIPYVHYEQPYNKIPDADTVEKILDSDPSITHVAMVHSETTSGILNDIQSVGLVARRHNCSFIVDAMSSFGGVDIPVKEWGIDFLVSSANKCIQGVPGFSLVICRRDKLTASQGKARTLSLDLYDQWQCMEKDGKWRFTSPTHTVLAFARALRELDEEGGIPARFERYEKNNRIMRQGLKKLGFEAYIDEEHQGPFITTFLYPQGLKFDFSEFYQFIKDRGYAIYPGKLTELDTFRIGNIGEIYPEDMERVISIIEEFLKDKRSEEK